MASYLDAARSMLGKNEVPDRAALQDYLSTGGANLDPATTAWCAAFVNASLGHAGMKGTGSNLARSFLGYGSPVDAPQPGDIAVFSRGDPKGPYGHVGFFEGLNPDGTIKVLGGNQGNAVSEENLPAARLLGYRRPDAPQEGPTMANAAKLATPTAPAAPVSPSSAPQPGQMAEDSGLGSLMKALAPAASAMGGAGSAPAPSAQMADFGTGDPMGGVNAAVGAAQKAKGLPGQLSPNVDLLMAMGKRPNGALTVG